MIIFKLDMHTDFKKTFKNFKTLLKSIINSQLNLNVTSVINEVCCCCNGKFFLDWVCVLHFLSPGHMYCTERTDWVDSGAITTRISLFNSS